MKKYIFATLALLLLVVTSCKNDEIEIIQTGNVTISVSNRDLYATLSMENGIQSQILGGESSNYTIGTVVLVYDNEGKLIAKKSEHVNTFQNLTFNFEGIANGSYTLVVVESVADTNDGDEFFAYQLVDYENLSTLRLDTQYDRLFWYMAAGVGTQQVNVTGNSSFNISPSPVGCIVDFGYENFANSGYVRLGFQLKNVADGIFLSPSHPASEKLYYENYTASGTWSNRGRFYNSGNPLDDEDEMDLFIIEMGEQSLCFGSSLPSQISSDGAVKFTRWPNETITFNFEAGKRYIAYCIYDEASSGLLPFMGTQDGFADWYNQYLKTLQLYEEPYIQWGGTVSAVKSYMSGFKVGNGGNITERNTNMWLLWYYGKHSEDETDYYFSNSTQGLYRSYVFFNSENVGEDQILKSMSDFGHQLIAAGEGYYIYQTTDGTTNIEIGLNSDGMWYVCYYDPSSPYNGASASRRLKMSPFTK